VIAPTALGWGSVGVVVTVAALLGLLTARAGDAPSLRRWHRGLHAACVLSWLLALWIAGVKLVAASTWSETLARGVLALLLATVALPFLHDVFAGLALAVEGRHRVGDDVRVEGVEGRIVAFGLRTVVLRDRDGTETTLSNRSFAARDVVRLNLERMDAPCHFEVTVPRDFDLMAGTKRLLEAATLSPYAAPGRRADVFVVADERGRVRLCVQGFVFDRAHAARYRGDVLLRAGMIDAPAS
jgi:small-conductance mechanosensitive channel